MGAAKKAAVELVGTGRRKAGANRIEGKRWSMSGRLYKAGTVLYGQWGADICPYRQLSGKVESQ
jgi:hypothetical protein